MSYTITITWNVYDVQELYPEWTLEQCSNALEHIEGDFEAMCIPDGWETLKACLKDYANTNREVNTI